MRREEELSGEEPAKGRYKPIAGPYQPPPVRIGDILQCERRGEVVVRGWSDGSRTGKACTFILCGDLVRAIRTEAELVVAYWWGVNDKTVGRWRGALGVGRVTVGTHQRWSDNCEEIFTPERRARAYAKCHSLEVQTRAAVKKRGQNRSGWTPEDDALLGMMLDREMAARTGHDVRSVIRRRFLLKIAPFDRQRQPAATVRLDGEALRDRRLALKLTQRQVAQRMGIRQAGYSLLENGHRWWCQRETAERLAVALECAVADLLEAEPREVVPEEAAPPEAAS